MGPLTRAPRSSLRVKITAVFAAAMAVLLVGLGLFVYARVQRGLDRSIDASLRSRSSDVTALVMQADTGLADAGRGALNGPGTGFAQILTRTGGVLDATPGLGRRALLGPGDLARAAGAPLMVADRRATALGDARLLATPTQAQGQRLVVVVGTSLRDRERALSDLRAVMLLGGPLALLLASALGYGALAVSMRRVEAMRRRASGLSVEEPGGRLPVPAARDELSRLADTLNAMLARSEEAFERERRFVADASHGLRTPLTVLRAEIDVALARPANGGDARATLASVGEEAERLSRLADDLLLLARADDGRLLTHPVEVSVADTFSRLRERFARRFAQSERRLIEAAGDDVTVWADPARLEQALGDLIDNALRHGGGDVVLLAEGGEEWAQVHVTDDGPGFPPGFLSLAFERFSRPARGRREPGSGLGLAIVRGIARAHGGEAHVANGRAGGADAWLVLPVTEAARARRRPEDAAFAATMGGWTHARLTRSSLSGANRNSEPARSGSGWRAVPPPTRR